MTEIMRRKLYQAYCDHPDGRTRAHKAAIKSAYESTIHELVEELGECKNTIRRNRNKMLLMSGAVELEEEPTCSICTDVMDGRVTLRCGHEMCPECFARHSRLNNTCPFCRDEFAPKVKKPNKIPLDALDAMADNWSNHTRQVGYFNQHLDINRNHFDRNRLEAENHLEWLVRENSKILLRNLKKWYDAEIN